MGGFSGGVYTRYHNWKQDRLNAINITDERMDAEDDGFAAALSQCILKNGTSIIEADVPFNNKRITGLADPASAGDALNQRTGDVRYVRADAPAVMSSNLIITSSSDKALVVGANGITNPQFQINASAASVANGIVITPQASGSNVYFDIMSPNANDGLHIRTKGVGALALTAGGGVSMASSGLLTTPMIDMLMDATGAGVSVMIQNATAAPPQSDTHLAGIGFHVVGAYGIKMGLRRDGTFGIGGWSAPAWSWYLTGGATVQIGSVSCAGVTSSAGIAAEQDMSVTGASPALTFHDRNVIIRRIVCSGGWIGTMRNDNLQWSWRSHNDGSSDIAGGFTAGGNVTAYSDETLKENIRTIPTALATVRTMRGVHYTMKETQKNGSGVIAQEMVNSAPELVDVTPEGIMTVAYGNICGYLIEALKEVADRLDRLDPPLKSEEPS